MKHIIILILFCYSSISKAQTTVISDTAFEQILINQGIDSDGIINGMILTSDATNVTELTLGSPQIYASSVTNLTGIEAFINLEKLEVYGAYLHNSGINLNTLTQLNYLILLDCHLQSINLNENILLEEVYLNNSAFDVVGNNITYLNLSNNPLVNKIGLRNNFITGVNIKNNTQTNVIMDLNIEFMFPLTTNYSICIEVDDENQASNNQGLYSNWQIIGPSPNQTNLFNYSFSENCTLNNHNNTKLEFKIYPNPTYAFINLEYDKAEIQLKEIYIYSLEGKRIRTFDSESNLNLEDLSIGNYILKILSNKEDFYKIIIKK